MAGDWIKMRVDLWDDPRAVRMASMLKANKATVCGALYRVWALGDQYTADGRLVGYTAETLDDSLGIPGFCEALRQVGWLLVEPDAVVIPDFAKHNGQSAKRRAQERDRKQLVRNPSASDADKKRTRSGLEGEGEDRGRGREEVETSTSDLDGAICALEEKREEVFRLLARIRASVPCRQSQDLSLVRKVALLTAAGRFSEDDLGQALEAVRLKGRNRPAAYFHQCMKNKAQDFGEKLDAMLAGTRIPPWLCDESEPR